MKVKNRKCIRHLSYKALWASRKRNSIAIIAIALTTLLFTSLFTIVLSINDSYQTYQFRQIGGWNHGTFKDVSQEQADLIANHAAVKAIGIRKVIGLCIEGVFAKIPAEISYMDANCTKWSYAEPTVGRMPQNGREIAMDTGALQLLGIEPELGTKITFTYTVQDKDQIGSDVTDTWTLVGYWEYDELLPVHYINISKEYAKEIEDNGIAQGMEPFRMDLNVMMASSIDIRGQMERVNTDLGYTWETYDDENSVRIGVNWGYTTAQVESGMDIGSITAMAAFIVLVIFTGYLIIYNIFQISVTEDIRFYGLLKTIGTTPKQIRRIIRMQAIFLCMCGIPVGILLGYGVGAVLTPVVLQNSTIFGAKSATVSTSPIIFVGSALFALVTVLLSCQRPGKIAAKVSPVEATKYTEIVQTKKKRRATRGAKVHQMAYANLGRNKSKTILVVISLALAVTLLNILYIFVIGFDVEKYTSRHICADFIVSNTDYFRFVPSAQEYISEEIIAQIDENTQQVTSGSGYTLMGEIPYTWMPEEKLRTKLSSIFSQKIVEDMFSNIERRGDMVKQHGLVEGLDRSLFEKVTVLKGSLDPLFDESRHTIAIAVEVDDYGNSSDWEYYPAIGDTLTLTYVSKAYYIDSRTGEKSTEETPEEFLKYYVEESHDVEYTVCALVTVPYSMSYRYHRNGYNVVLPVEKLEKDSEQSAMPLFYLFDTPDQTTEADAERYLADLTKGDTSELMYQSKETVRKEFQEFQNMFLLLGGLLCAIIGFVGILNFFNAIMTGILSRRREFAVLQSVGMTNRQLKTMLIYEGLFYALSSAIVALILSLGVGPLVGKLLENMFWFFTYRFTLLPVLVAFPIFVGLGYSIPFLLYGQTARYSVVERLRET